MTVDAEGAVAEMGASVASGDMEANKDTMADLLCAPGSDSIAHSLESIG